MNGILKVHSGYFYDHCYWGPIVLHALVIKVLFSQLIQPTNSDHLFLIQRSIGHHLPSTYAFTLSLLANASSPAPASHPPLAIPGDFLATRATPTSCANHFILILSHTFCTFAIANTAY